MKSWRPDDWDSPYEPIGADLHKMGREIAYEAGADAMLEALNKNRVTVPDIIYFLTKGKREGHLVLIPDQKPPDGCNSHE